MEEGAGLIQTSRLWRPCLCKVHCVLFKYAVDSKRAECCPKGGGKTRAFKVFHLYTLPNAA